MRLLAVVCCLPALTGCILVDADESHAGPKIQKSKAQEASNSKGVIASTKLALAEVKADSSRIEAESGLKAATAKLVDAEFALENFNSVEKAIELGRAKLELDRVAGRASDAEAELQELESMYSEEEFASLTKELVLARGRRSLEHAKRSLEFQTQEYTHLESQKLAAKERKLQRAVEEARSAVRTAELKLKAAKLRNEMDLIEAKEAVEKVTE